METGHSGPRGGAVCDELIVAAFGSAEGSIHSDREPAVESGDGRAWLRAVALAGRGRFSAARVAAAQVREGAFSSAARCLEASMLRQVGRHREAAAVDGVAFADAIASVREPGVLIASAWRVDAAVGLAADALGTGRFALSARMLARADQFLAAAPGGEQSDRAAGAEGHVPWWTIPRARLRRDWVAAELAIYSGDVAGAAAAATTLLDATPGLSRPRHHAKTILIAAAALAVTGEGERAAETAARAHAVAHDAGLDPLQWAGAKLMTGLSAGEHGESFARDAAVVEARWIRDGAEFGRL